MATRQQTHEQKAALKRALREEFARGELVRGAPAPSQRHLAERFGVSHPVVAQVVRELVAEGLFHIVPRLGTFVGSPVAQGQSRETYVFLTDAHSLMPEREGQLRMGFEDRVARRGGAVLCLDKSQGQEWGGNPPLSSVAGVFEWALHLDAALSGRLFEHPEQVARVRFAGTASFPDSIVRDSVSFEDADGGCQATEHLLALGHERIAFLGLHFPPQSGKPEWSNARENGWREALQARGLSGENLSFHPSKAPQQPYALDHALVGREAAQKFVAQMVASQTTAVVAANDRVTGALLEELQNAGVNRSQWPAIVSFDNEGTLTDACVTSLRLPWDKLGQMAADLLWERRQGQAAPQPQHRGIQMRLIPRLTCRADWPSLPAYAVLSEGNKELNGKSQRLPVLIQ